ncbi:MAG: hypothetical protein ACFFBD_13955, partial [Candidatus Hodarchaeota archaeon]
MGTFSEYEYASSVNLFAIFIEVSKQNDMESLSSLCLYLFLSEDFDSHLLKNQLLELGLKNLFFLKTKVIRDKGKRKGMTHIYAEIATLFVYWILSAFMLQIV